MRRTLSSFIFALPLAMAALAAARAEDSSESIVVTATRTPQPADKTGESVSLITAQQLDRQQIASVTDALQQTPSIEEVHPGGLGQSATTVSIRGAEVGQTLVLVDGVRLNDPSTVDNEAVLGDLLVNDMERIEILRGPQSTLYGSDAIGGVVNVFTRHGGNTPLALRASVEGGSFGTYHVNAAANGTAVDVEYGAAANFLHTNGTSAADSRNGNPETDGYTNGGLTENVRVHLGEAASLDVRSYYTSSGVDFDDNYVFVPPATFRIADSAAYAHDSFLATYVGFNFDLLGGAFSNRIAAIGSDARRAYYHSAFDIVHKNSDDDGETRRLEYQGTLQIVPEDQLTFGAEYQRVAFTGKTFGFFASVDRGNSQIASIYAQNMLTLFNQLTITAGLRHDDDAEFGGHNSVKIAVAWSLNSDGTVLHANYGDGFKAPTLFEQFSEFSNPLHALEPEVAHGWEAGVEQRLLDGALVAQATWFSRRTNDQIDFVTPDCFTSPPPEACKTRPLGYYDNVRRTSAEGIEVEATALVGDTLSLNGTLTDMIAKDLTTGLDLQRRPHITASSTVEWTPAPDWSAGATLIYVGRRFDSQGEIHPLGADTLVKLFASHRVNDSLELFARVENLFNAQYEPIFGYGAPGRAAYGGIRVTY